MTNHHIQNINILRTSLIAFFLLTWMGTALRAQTPTHSSALERMPNLLKTADIRAMLPHLNTNLEITLQDREQSCTLAQAEVILRNFFAKHPPKDFKLLHKGNTGQGGAYLMGTLTSTSGSTFRTSIVFFEKNGQNLVQQLRFE
jgi:hypothetical protein